MPTSTKDKSSVDELENAYNAPTKGHPLGPDETNAYPKIKQPITPPAESDPGYQQTGEENNAPGQGDTELKDSRPTDSTQTDTPHTENAPGETPTQQSNQSSTTPPGGNTNASGTFAKNNSGQVKNFAGNAAQNGVQNAAKEQIKNSAKDFAKKGAKNVANKVTSEAAKQAVKRTADALAPGSGEAVGKAVEVGTKVGKKVLRGRFREGFKELQKQFSKENIQKTVDKYTKYIGIGIGVLVTVSIIGMFMFITALVCILGFCPSDKTARSELLINNLTITKKSTPENVPNNTPFDYTITIDALEGAGEVVVKDTLPTEVTLVNPEALPNGVTASNGNSTLTWNSTTAGLTAPFTTSFTIRVMPTVSDTYVVNMAIGTLNTATGERGTPTCTGYQCALQYIVTYSRITSGFRTPERPNHNGIDLAAASGTPIYAVEGGSITWIERSCTPNSGYRGNTCGEGAGNSIFIKTATRGLHKYMHMQNVAQLSEGAIVTRGQRIGELDHTGDSGGPHLHFGVYNPGPVNPETVLTNWPN